MTHQNLRAEQNSNTGLIIRAHTFLITPFFFLKARAHVISAMFKGN